MKSKNTKYKNTKNINEIKEKSIQIRDQCESVILIQFVMYFLLRYKIHSIRRTLMLESPIYLFFYPFLTLWLICFDINIIY